MDIPFTQRFEYITAITKALTTAGTDPASSKAQAIANEAEIFNTAQSTDEYHQRCNTFINRPAPEDDPEDSESIDQSIYVNQIFNESGPTIGPYKHATFHADGLTSTIYKAKPLSPTSTSPDQIVALKVTHPSQLQPPHDSHREIRLLNQASPHPNIIPLLSSFPQPGGKLILIFPFLQHDLENLLRTSTLPPHLKPQIYKALFSALSHIHSLGIIHRDIKPSNILLSSLHSHPQISLIDFGIAWSPTDPSSEPAHHKITDVGTTCYRPPELLFGHRAYDISLDIWAAGCVVAELIRPRHSPLFDAGELGSELALIKSVFSTLGTPTDEIWPSARSYPDWGKVRFKDFPGQRWEEIMPTKASEVVDFMRRTVCFEPTTRLTAGEALEHPVAECIGRVS